MLASIATGPQNSHRRQLHPDRMPNRLRRLVAWTLLAQVLLVGGLGTGLHSLFGCEHGPSGICASGCCSLTDDTAARSDCHDCGFCRDVVCEAATCATDCPTTGPTTGPIGADRERVVASVDRAGCQSCAVCDLLAQYHSVTPFEFDTIAIELASGEAAMQRQNAVVAASIRLALSRGPPTA